MRVLITGSRTWTDRSVIATALDDVEDAHSGPYTLVSGACTLGGDYLCEEYAEQLGWDIERHHADWSAHGRRAGFVRNAKMVELGADLCIAFIHDESKGATMTADLAERAGIPVIRHLSSGRLPSHAR